MSEHDQWDIVSGVGVTALAIALARAIESARDDAIITDPYARHFLTAIELPPELSRWPRVDQLDDVTALAPWWHSMPAYMANRTRFFDDFAFDATVAGVDQVAIVAAGLDTRAYRLSYPEGCSVYEIDQSLVLKFKDEVLDGHGVRPACERHAVAADLRDDWGAELRASGFDASRPTAWLVEGLLSFLTPETEERLFATIRALSAPGSRLGVEAIGGSVRHMALRTDVGAAWRSEVGLPIERVWQTGSRPEPVDVLRAGGWTVAVDRVAEAGRRNGRPVEGVMNPPAEHAMLLDCRL